MAPDGHPGSPGRIRVIGPADAAARLRDQPRVAIKQAAAPRIGSRRSGMKNVSPFMKMV